MTTQELAVLLAEALEFIKASEQDMDTQTPPPNTPGNQMAFKDIRIRIEQALNQ